MTCSQGLSAAVPACFDDICYQCARVMRFKRAAMASLKGLSSVDPAYFYTLSYQVVLECCSSVVLSSSNSSGGLHERIRYIDLYVYNFIDRYIYRTCSRAVIKYSVLSSDRIVFNCASCLH